MRTSLFAVTLAALALALAAVAHADEPKPMLLTIKNHEFSPKELHIPADTRVILTVKNEDPTPAEFESEELKREKVIRGNGEVKVKLGPLKPGTYPFFEEFHPKTTGVVIVK